MVLHRRLQKGNSGHSAALCPSIQRSQIGQRTLIIGTSALRLRLFCRRLAGAGRLGRAVRVGLAGGSAAGVGRRRLGRLLVLLRRRLVRLAAVVGFVEAGPLEQDGGPRAEQAAQLLLAAARTFGQYFVVKALKLLEGVLTGVADVIVCGHGWLPR